MSQKKFLITYIVLLIIFTEKATYFLIPKLRFCTQAQELSLRNLDDSFISVSDPNLFYIPKKNSPVFNSLGIADKEYTPEKGPNTLRILVLGDSITEGQNLVSRNKLYHEILEKKLNSMNNAIDYEIWNCGVRKYNTIQEYMYLKNHLIQYNPDIVILGYVENNDYDPPRIKKEKTRIHRKNIYLAIIPKLLPISEKNHDFLVKSNIYKFLNMLLYDIMSRINPLKYPHIIFSNNYGKEHVEINRQALMDTYILCKKNNIKFLLVVFPTLSNNKKHRDYWINNQNKNIPKILLINDYLKYSKNLESFRIYRDDFCHPNERGHEIAAESILKTLKNLGWLYK